MQTIIRSRKNGVTIRITVEDEPTPGTLGSHQLLLDEYRLLEKSPKYKQLLFNSYFLRKMKSKYKTLHCVYCGKKNLRIYHWREFAGNRKDMATADHFIAKSIAPELFAMDESNLRVACHDCNSKKANYYWDEKFPYPEIQQDEKETHCQRLRSD